MDTAAATSELSAEGAGAYCSTVSLIGQVIALHGTRIARERSRPRPDRIAIVALEHGRNAAVQACRTLSSTDSATLDAVRDTYSRLYLELLSGTVRSRREPGGS